MQKLSSRWTCQCAAPPTRSTALCRRSRIGDVLLVLIKVLCYIYYLYILFTILYYYSTYLRPKGRNGSASLPPSSFHWRSLFNFSRRALNLPYSKLLSLVFLLKNYTYSKKNHFIWLLWFLFLLLQCCLTNICFIMKVTPQQWIEIVKLISTFIVGVITTLFVQSCTVSMSVSKNNQNSTQKTEQTSTSSIDSTKININR